MAHYRECTAIGLDGSRRSLPPPAEKDGGKLEMWQMCLVEVVCVYDVLLIASVFMIGKQKFSSVVILIALTDYFPKIIRYVQEKAMLAVLGRIPRALESILVILGSLLKSCFCFQNGSKKCHMMHYLISRAENIE